MPKSIVEERVEAAWADVTAAVSKGLTADKGEKTLADVVPIVVKKPAKAAWLPSRTLAMPEGWLWQRESAAPLAAIDYEFRLRIKYDELVAPDLEQITRWAAVARTFELFDVLRRLVAVGPVTNVAVAELGNGAPRGGWGQIRCVTFKLDLALAESLESVKKLGWDGPVPLTSKLPGDLRTDCLLLRKGGGPQLRRAAGLTLGWLPALFGHVDLVLAEQFEIVDAEPQTVAAIHLVP